MKPLLKGALLVASTIVLVALLFIWRVNSFLDAPVMIGDDGFILEVEPGTAFGVVSKRLGEQGVLAHPDWLRWYARLTGDAAEIKAGEYRIARGSTPRDILTQLVVGNVRQYAFTIIEGWTFKDLMAALERDPHIKHTVTRQDWPKIAEELGISETHPEGLFLPETYHFTKASRDIDILDQAYRLMQAVLQEEWQNRDASLPLKAPYDALILSSIVEKETALAEERPRISGVFIRRLEKGMRLQTDPTVIYGLGDAFDGNLKRSHLQADTPYNTYRRAGLPPTPIAMAGHAAIRAALHPDPGTELYFVASPRLDGSHQFSTTKEQHDTAVAAYLRGLRAARNTKKQ